MKKKALKRPAQVALVVIMALIAFTVIALVIALASSANAAELEWRHFGAAPYATSHEDACRKSRAAIDGFSMPLAAKEHFKAVLGATCSGGTEVWLMPHQQLEQMWSGPDAHNKSAHLMNRKPVAELSVIKSPEGRPYPKGSVGESPKTLSWTFIYEGKTYVLYLPRVCFNWSWSVTVPECATVAYTVDPGDPVRFSVLSQKRLPASACWQLCDGGECSMFPSESDCRDCGWLGPLTVVPSGFKPFHSGVYVAHSAKQTLRFPREVKENYVALCVEREGLGDSDADVVTPQDWQGRDIHYVPIEWPLWGTTQNGSYVLPGK